MDIFLYIIIAIVVGGTIILSWWYNSPKYKGKEGVQVTQEQVLVTK